MSNIFLEAKLRTLNKQKRRTKKEKYITKVERFEEDMKLHDERMVEASKQKRIKELLDTIRAFQIIGVDTTSKKQELKEILIPHKDINQ